MSVRTMIGDCRAVLPTLPDNSVQCVVTSPPYYGLRDYQTATWEGGDSGCDHLGAPQRTRATLNANWGEGFADVKNADARYPMGATCSKCGARRIDAQIGLEPTPEVYLQQMVEVFRLVRRVLRDDGTCWVNMGDSYNSQNGFHRGEKYMEGGTPRVMEYPDRSGCGLKPKDLLMMPARLALALQADGWWLRSDIIWHKPNPMPESVTDRPTNAHEHVFLLTKRSRYFYDADAVREPHDDKAGGVERFGNIGSCGGYQGGGYGDAMVRPDLAKVPGGRSYNPAGRACRNVWTIATHAFSAAHFATFPPALVERCIRAGTSERGCCAACGKPWTRTTDTSYTDACRGMVGNQRKAVTDERVMHAGREQDKRLDKHDTTTGWAAGCACGAEVRPCTVLDPFGGAGTTGLVADRLQRDAVMIELNPAYTAMADARIVDDCPLFSSWPPAEDPADGRMADLFREPLE